MTTSRAISRLMILAFYAGLAMSVAACAKTGASAGLKAQEAQAEPSKARQLAKIEPAAGKAAKVAKAKKKPVEPAPDHIADPIEPVNRAIFGFNDILDQILIGPAAEVYNTVLPGFVRSGVQNFMRNLRAPLIVANSLLQGDVSNAGVATARFIINTTVGVGGVVDVAQTQGLRYRSEDFGQTLGAWGMGQGFYLVLPVIGPSSLRDTTGLTADSYADPLRIWSFKTGHDWIYYTRNAVEGFDNRARLAHAVNDLRRNSLDYYAAVRSAYAQRRVSDVRNEDADSLVIPDYDDKN